MKLYSLGQVSVGLGAAFDMDPASIDPDWFNAKDLVVWCGCNPDDLVLYPYPATIWT